MGKIEDKGREAPEKEKLEKEKARKCGERKKKETKVVSRQMKIIDISIDIIIVNLKGGKKWGIAIQRSY